MFTLLYTKTPPLLSPLLRNLGDSTTHLLFLQIAPVINDRSFSLYNNKRSIGNGKNVKETSFTVSYLINSCGLSMEVAKSVSKKVQFSNHERPDSFLALLKKHGFTNSQITKIVKTCPKLLLADSEKNVFPKLEFFSSIGLNGPNLARLISSQPAILQYSLSDRITPAYNFIKSALLFDDDMVLRAVRFPSRIFLQDAEKITTPNFLVLRELGMPQSVIKKVLIFYPFILCSNVKKFSEKVKKVIHFGFCPTKVKFLQALHSINQLSESTWQHKIEVYEKWGWSKDEILLAFKKQPLCMTLSEKKINGAMDFLVNVMDMKPSAIAANPHILFFSLKKRTIPRGSVIKMLMLKGVLKKSIGFYSVLILSEKCFLEMYVDKHREHIPHLLNVFEGRMCLQELVFESEDNPGAQEARLLH